MFQLSLLLALDEYEVAVFATAVFYSGGSLSECAWVLYQTLQSDSNGSKRVNFLSNIVAQESNLTFDNLGIITIMRA